MIAAQGFRAVFLFDDGFGLDAVQQLGKGGLDVLADVTGHHQQEQVVTGLQVPFIGLGHDGEDAGALFHLVTDGVHLGLVMADGDGADRRMVLA